MNVSFHRQLNAALGWYSRFVKKESKNVTFYPVLWGCVSVMRNKLRPSSPDVCSVKYHCLPHLLLSVDSDPEVSGTNEDKRACVCVTVCVLSSCVRLAEL